MIYAFGAFELDTRVYELRRRGDVCPVEPQVFDVLTYLAEHRDRVVSKEELLEKLWPDRFVSETTLTSRLKAARKAVGDDGKAQSVIRTLHGRGYRFVADVRIVEAGENVVLPSRPLAAATSRPKGFVGRDAELARLDGALGRALEGKRQIVFVTGEAGAGKTTLVETFLGRIRTDSILVARGQCVEHRGTGEPYMPLLDAIGRLCRDTRHGAQTIETLRREAPGWLLQMPSLVSDDEAAALAVRSPAGDRMLRELAMFIERVTEAMPLVVLVEDLHWSDSATLEAIDLLARHPHPARLLVIGTFRPSDVRASRHPVYAAAQELRARSQCEIVELPLLATREIADYLEQRMPHAEFTSELATLLHARTSGNPLFVGNLVSSWTTRGFIREENGTWTLEEPMTSLETDVPATLQQLIEKQVAELDDEDQRMLETASVIGREFSIAFLASTIVGDEEDLERRCESLARMGRFVGAAGTQQWGDGTFTSRFAFTHDLYVDVLYDRIPEARRARVHHHAGQVLERAWNGRERERAAELALHFSRARDRARAIRYLELAGEQAMQRSAYREAVLHFTAALEHLPEIPRSAARDADEVRLRARLAPALIATRGYSNREAEKNYRCAADLARALGDATTLSQVLYGMAIMFEYRGDCRKAEEIALERLALDGESSTASSVESHELLACSMLHQGRYSEAVQHGERALAAADEDYAPVDLAGTVRLVQAHGWISGGLVFIGRGGDAVVHNAAAIALAESRDDDLARASALAQAGFVRYYRREVRECRELSEAAAVVSRERRLPFHLACARILLGWCLAHEGAAEEGVREVRAGIRTSLSIGAKIDMPLFLAILAECLERAGDHAGAMETLDEAYARIGRNRSFFYMPELYRMSAELLLARGDRETAMTALERAAALAEEQGSPLFAARVADTWKTVGEA